MDTNGRELNQFIRVQPGRPVACCLANVKLAPFTSLSDEDFMLNLKGKVLGQVNLVRFALWHLRAGGSITLTSGVFELPHPREHGWSPHERLAQTCGPRTEAREATSIWQEAVQIWHAG